MRPCKIYVSADPKSSCWPSCFLTLSKISVISEIFAWLFKNVWYKYLRIHKQKIIYVANAYILTNHVKYNKYERATEWKVKNKINLPTYRNYWPPSQKQIFYFVWPDNTAAVQRSLSSAHRGGEGRWTYGCLSTVWLPRALVTSSSCYGALEIVWLLLLLL